MLTERPVIPASLRPFFSYYGGKWRDTKNYPVPLHRTIVEPFAGSAGYSLRYSDRDVILCDRDPVIVALWRYLIAATPEEILALPDVPDGKTVNDLDVPDGARHLIGFWMNAATAQPCISPSKWMRSGSNPGSFWGNRVRATVARQVSQIRHWTIIEGCYSSLPETHGPATWFVDPPYQIAGKHYRFGSKGINYDALGDWCRARTGQVIVCENAGATWLPFRGLATTKTARKGRWSDEAYWLNTFDEGAP